MKKFTLLSTSMLIALALVIAPYAAFAGNCSGKTDKTGADATMINSKAAEMDQASSEATKVNSKARQCTGSFSKTSCSADKGVKMTKTEADSQVRFATATFAVNGMTCGGCEKSVDTKLTKTDGVGEVMKVCHKSNEVILTYDPAKVNTDDLTKAITNMGYEAKVMPADKDTDNEKM